MIASQTLSGSSVTRRSCSLTSGTDIAVCNSPSTRPSSATAAATAARTEAVPRASTASASAEAPAALASPATRSAASDARSTTARAAPSRAASRRRFRLSRTGGPCDGAERPPAGLRPALDALDGSATLGPVLEGAKVAHVAVA